MVTLLLNHDLRTIHLCGICGEPDSVLFDIIIIFSAKSLLDFGDKDAKKKKKGSDNKKNLITGAKFYV